MGGKLLLFGFESLLQILALEAAVKPFDVELVPVARTDYNKTLAVLAGLDAAPGPVQPYAGGTLGGRMIVLCGLAEKLDALLPVLAKAGAGPDCMKAVLTPHNRSWNAVTLYTELLRERQAIQGKS
ncbi:DUF3783 domain-containing protein [uncultured Dysosmobacter sp.]|uniref:DUF3783 domain-containing protein n=1 Tax=uncultured Dysosmobacter sp. TaxID=2591384 RepID=UPI00261E5EAD|nr:DUF3783 domain-containing protein [uncultured Dysosmobacter sp.]